MKSETIFVDLLNRITASLEDTGLYSINCEALLFGAHHSSYDDLRKKILNGQTELRFDIDCFIGPTAWKDKDQDITSFFLEMADVDLEDIAKYFKKDGD